MIGSARRAFVLTVLCVTMAPAISAAQGDEIQVYDGGLAPVGVFNLTWHNNFTPKGIEAPSFPGAIRSHKSLNGVTEWALGVTDWFEAGLYLPLYSHDDRLGWKVDGFKLRTLFAVPHAAERTFVYGVNIEYSYNAKVWDEQRFTSEIRPIVGWHLGRVDLIFNPIVDTRYDGLKNLEFVPSTRLAFNASSKWAVAVEEYADYGLVSDFERAANQAHQVFGILSYSGSFEVEAGVGVGLTDASDKLQFKIIFAKDLGKLF